MVVGGGRKVRCIDLEGNRLRRVDYLWHSFPQLTTLQLSKFLLTQTATQFRISVVWINLANCSSSILQAISSLLSHYRWALSGSCSDSICIAISCNNFQTCLLCPIWQESTSVATPLRTFRQLYWELVCTISTCPAIASLHFLNNSAE